MSTHSSLMQNPHFHIWNCRKVYGKNSLKKASPIKYIYWRFSQSHTQKGIKHQEKIVLKKVDNKDRKLEKLRKTLTGKKY